MESIKWLWFGFSAGEGANITPLPNSFHQLHLSSLPNGKRDWELIEMKGLGGREGDWLVVLFVLFEWVRGGSCRNAPRKEKTNQTKPTNWPIHSLFFPFHEETSEIEKKEEQRNNEIAFLVGWVCCGLRAGAPATAPQQKRRAPTRRKAIELMKLKTKGERAHTTNKLNCLWSEWASVRRAASQ